MDIDTSSRSAAIIQLTLKEYDSLRGQLVANLLHTGGLTGLGITALAVLFTFSGVLIIASIGGVLITAVLGYSYYVLMRMNILLSRHIARLERRLNQLSQEAYGVQNDAFTWESRYESGELSLQAPGYRLLRRRLP
jgi:hypothetical protein